MYAQVVKPTVLKCLLYQLNRSSEQAQPSSDSL